MNFTRNKKEDQTVGDYLMYCYERDIHNEQLRRFGRVQHDFEPQFRPPTDFFTLELINEGNIKLCEQRIEGLQSQIREAEEKIQRYLENLDELRQKG